MPIPVNFLLFQAGWFLCVWGGANDRPWLGVAVAALVIAFHLKSAAHPRSELALVTATALVGLIWDSALVAAGLIEYPSGNLAAGMAPVWIVAMWAMFATTLNISLRWLRHHLRLAAGLGAVGGPLAYYAGAGLGGAGLADPVAALATQAAGWTLIMPVLLVLAGRLDATPVVAREDARQCLN